MKDEFQAAFCRVTRELEAAEARVKELESLAMVLEAESGSHKARAEAAEALLKEAGKALEPFADEAEAWDGYDDSEALIEEFPTYCGKNIRVGQLRADRALLERKP